jgi:beta-glucosidase
MEDSKSETKLQFPAGFLLGAASAAHQVEGDNINSDWWHYEQQGRLPKSGLAADHYHKYDEDFGLAEQMGLNAVRISIEWARIEPEEGRWNANAIEHYKKVLESMKKHGLTRVVTLWHWTLPKWLADKGGFETKEGVEAFGRFAWFVAQNLGKEVDLWITVNEPEVYTQASYTHGTHPPFKKSLSLTWQVIQNLIQAHRAAYKAIKESLGEAPVGIAKNNAYFIPDRPNNILDKITCWVVEQIANRYFLEKIDKQNDFIGLNYYFCIRTRFDWNHGYRDMNENFTQDRDNIQNPEKRSDMGWLLFPEGIYHLLKKLKRYKKPIYITENGLADGADSRRPEFLRETLQWLVKARSEGVDLRGYLHWALTDNYEWHDGFGPRFGLIEINYGTQERKVRDSAKIFKEIKFT